MDAACFDRHAAGTRRPRPLPKRRLPSHPAQSLTRSRSIHLELSNRGWPTVKRLNGDHQAFRSDGCPKIRFDDHWFFAARMSQRSRHLMQRVTVETLSASANTFSKTPECRPLSEEQGFPNWRVSRHDESRPLRQLSGSWHFQGIPQGQNELKRFDPFILMWFETSGVQVEHR